MNKEIIKNIFDDILSSDKPILKYLYNEKLFSPSIILFLKLSTEYGGFATIISNT